MRGSSWCRAGRRGVFGCTAGVTAGMLLLDACAGNGAPHAAPVTVAAPVSAPVVVSAVLTANPADGAQGVLSDATPTLSLSGGHFSSVLLRDAAGYEVPGTLDTSGAGWQATGALAEGKRYTFEAGGIDSAGHPFHNISSFATIPTSKVVKAWVSPLAGTLVGVGQPIAIEFSHPVRDRAAVERQLHVETSQPVVGAWHWESDTVIHYRPRRYWPANTRVVLHTDLKDVAVGDGRYGDQNRTIPFTVGRKQVTVVDVKNHHMQVFRDDRLIRTIAVSTGKKGYITRGGLKVVLGLDREKHMTGEAIGIQKDDPDYFDLQVKYAVRMTWSGEFLHAAPWQGSNQGRANVSHGCVGMKTADAKWYFDHTIIGDVVDVQHSSRKMELRNGYGDWNLSWADWLAGSALPHDAEVIDPSGAGVGAGADQATPDSTATPTPVDNVMEERDAPATATPSSTPATAPPSLETATPSPTPAVASPSPTPSTARRFGDLPGG
jgi:lipoprotein-anchoring transpeptidase ErfK/SrfK